MEGSMKKLLATLILCCFIPQLAVAESRWKKIFKFSCVAMIVSNGLDVHSSWGYQEGHALVRSADGHFGPRGLSIKVGMVSGTILTEYLVARLLKKHSREEKAYKVFSTTNFFYAGTISGVAIRNYAVRYHFDK